MERRNCGRGGLGVGEKEEKYGGGGSRGGKVGALGGQKEVSVGNGGEKMEHWNIERKRMERRGRER